jgi:MINDY deubiquitinase
MQSSRDRRRSILKRINWADHTGQLRESPILVQNKNGPCPLLALVNSLVLRSEKSAHSPIVKALQTREHISLGLLIQALFDELTTSRGADEQLPDIEDLSRFLTMLYTGMNVNPRLTLVIHHTQFFLI